MDGRTEGSRKEVGSVQGEGDGRGAVDAAVCIRLFLRTRLRQRRSARWWVGTFTWPDLKWSDRRLRTGAVTRERGRGRARKYPLFFRSSLFFLRLCPSLPPSLFPSFDLSEASLLGSAGCGRGRSHAAGVTRILLPPPEGRQDGSRGQNM